MAVDPLHLSAALLVRWLLVFGRLMGLLAVMPLFGERTVPAQVRVGLAGVGAFVLLWVPASQPLLDDPSLLALGLAFAKELLVGVMVGYLARLVFAALQFAVNALDVQIGLSFVQLVNPAADVNLSVLGQFLNTLLLLLFLELDGHHLLLRGLVATYQFAPAGAAMPNPAAVGSLTSLLGVLVQMAIQVALPVVLVLLLIDVAMGIVGRVVPQLNVFLVSLPVKIMVGLGTLWITLPVLAVVMRRALETIAGDTRLLAQMVR